MALAPGAKVVAASVAVPANQHVKVSFGTVEWDSGSFFAPSAPRRLRIPARRAGRYLTQLAIRYVATSDPMSPPVDPGSSYYYAELLVNNQPPGNDARATAARVPHATGTTQLIVYEANLEAGDRIQARLWHGFADQVRADVYLQTRRVCDSS
jgi:hypothetical protein